MVSDSDYVVGRLGSVGIPMLPFSAYCWQICFVRSVENTDSGTSANKGRATYWAGSTSKQNPTVGHWNRAISLLMKMVSRRLDVSGEERHVQASAGGLQDVEGIRRWRYCPLLSEPIISDNQLMLPVGHVNSGWNLSPGAGTIDWSMTYITKTSTNHIIVVWCIVGYGGDDHQKDNVI